MALFNNYNKPGAGVSKNSGYEINRFALYFQLLGRKFWSLCVLSLTITLYTLPYLLVSVALFYVAQNIPFLLADIRIILMFIGLPFAFYGPVLSAAFKIGRDFAREEPVFLFSDFWTTVKKNIGKPILLSAISYFFVFALTFALPTYYSLQGIGTYVLFPLCMLAALVVIFIQFYIYTMSVCFELSTKNILKNALILSLVSIGQNLLVFLVLVLLIALSVFFVMLSLAGYTIMFAFLFILLVCFIPAYFVYTASFVTYPVLQKYVVEPFYEANPEKTSAVLNNPVQDNSDREETFQKEIPEYVYHNGRMVHRSVLESESLFDDERKIGPDNQ